MAFRSGSEGIVLGLISSILAKIPSRIGMARSCRQRRRSSGETLAQRVSTS